MSEWPASKARAERVNTPGLRADLENCRQVRNLLRAHVRMLRILLAWHSGAILAHEAETMMGLGRGELWALEKREVEAVSKYGG